MKPKGFDHKKIKGLTMFAIIRTGGKQYKVQKDTKIQVERLDAKAGDTIKIQDVLLVNDGKTTTIGAPVVSGATVTAEIVAETRGPKLIVFKKRRRQNSRRKNGHRQDLMMIKITDIKAA